MERRAFLIRGGTVMLTLPVGWAVVGCGSSDTPTTNVTTSGLQFTSSSVGAHTHDFAINTQDLTQPSSAGVSGDTTNVQGHVHVVSLSQAELNQIEANQTVTKDTSVVSAHSHTFQFSLAAGVPTGGTGTGAAGSTATGAAGRTGGAGTGPGGVYGKY